MCFFARTPKLQLCSDSGSNSQGLCPISFFGRSCQFGWEFGTCWILHFPEWQLLLSAVSFSVDHVNSLVSAERMLESGMRWVLHFPEWQLQLAVAETETKSHGIKKHGSNSLVKVKVAVALVDSRLSDDTGYLHQPLGSQ